MATFINRIKHAIKTGTNKVKAGFYPVTEEDITHHNYILEKLKNEQKLLADRLQRNIYKDRINLIIAQKAQNRSFHRIRDELDRWDELVKHPKEKLIEEKRFREKAIKIQKQYENIVENYAKEKGICTFLEDKDNCKTGLNCYWFGKDDVAGKDVGCYSKIQTRSFPIRQKNDIQATINRRRKKVMTLNTIQDRLGVGGRKKKKTKRKRKLNKSQRKSRKRKSRKRKSRKKRGGKKKMTAKEYWKPGRFSGKTWWMPRELKTGVWFHDTLKYGIPTF